MILLVVLLYSIATAILIANIILRPIRKLWVILWGLAPVILTYLVNPGFRIFSFHSFMHGSIVYQIVNGRIPPPDPLVAGKSLHYPWVPHLLAAAICKIFDVTPFLAIPALNMISSILVILLVVKISQVLVNDERTNLLSAIFAIYAFTPFIVEMVRLVHARVQPEIRGIPLIDKFITINALPLGLIGWFLTIYGALLYYSHANPRKPFLVVAAGIALTGFLYPAFLPGIAASILLGFPVSWLVSRSNMAYFVRTAVMWLAFFGVVAILIPYLKSIAGSAAHAMILDKTYLKQNIINYFIVNLPILVLFLIVLRCLLSTVRRIALLVISVPVISTLAAYLSIHLTFNNEYKFLLLSSTTLGILGGPILCCFQKRFGRLAAFFILMLFLLPTFRILWLRSSVGQRVPNTFFEEGMVLKTRSGEQDLYDWIRNQTPLDAIFIDTELEIPVLGQRQILIPYSATERKQRKGYGNIKMILISQSGYSREEIERRIRIASSLYESGCLSTEDWQYLSNLGNHIYIVARKPKASQILQQKGYPVAYRSQSWQSAIYRIMPPVEVNKAE